MMVPGGLGNRAAATAPARNTSHFQLAPTSFEMKDLQWPGRSKILTANSKKDKPPATQGHCIRLCFSWKARWGRSATILIKGCHSLVCMTESLQTTQATHIVEKLAKPSRWCGPRSCCFNFSIISLWFTMLLRPSSSLTMEGRMLGSEVVAFEPMRARSSLRSWSREFARSLPASRLLRSSLGLEYRRHSADH